MNVYIPDPRSFSSWTTRRSALNDDDDARGGHDRPARCLHAATAVALDEPRHHRFWWGFGLGGGWQTWKWYLGTAGERSAAGHVRLGGTVNRHVLFGAEAHALFVEDRPGEDAGRANITTTDLVHAGAEGGWCLKGGFGVAEVEETGADRGGVGVTAGTGFDFRIARNLYVTPNVDLLMRFHALETNASLTVTLGLTWH